jgi:hypothetical protein
MVETVTREDRERLLARLRPDRPAEAACAAALSNGANVLGWRETAAAADLLALYERRLTYISRGRATMLGKDQLLRDLQRAARKKRRLTTWVVFSNGWQFVVMLDPGGDSQACLGIEIAGVTRLPD